MGIDPETNRARNGSFHSSRVICAGQQFHGLILCSGAEGADALQRIVGDHKTLYVGRGVSRGQGRALLTIHPYECTPEEEMLARVEHFNGETAKRFPELADWMLFSCLLKSSTIVYDRCLLSKSCLEGGDLGFGFEDYKPLAWFSRGVTVSGWHAGARLPKPDTRGISAGSCFLLGRKIRSPDRPAEMHKLAAAFTNLEARGVGERLEEGFGETAFCDPFHWRHGIREVEA